MTTYCFMLIFKPNVIVLLMTRNRTHNEVTEFKITEALLASIHPHSSTFPHLTQNSLTTQQGPNTKQEPTSWQHRKQHHLLLFLFAFSPLTLVLLKGTLTCLDKTVYSYRLFSVLAPRGTKYIGFVFPFFPLLNQKTTYVYLFLAAKPHHFCAFYWLIALQSFSTSPLRWPGRVNTSSTFPRAPVMPTVRKCPEKSPRHGWQLQLEGKIHDNIPIIIRSSKFRKGKNKWLQAYIIYTSAQQDA